MKSSHKSLSSNRGGESDLIKELLGAIKELNSSHNSNVGGMRKEVVDLASSFHQSFSQLAKRVLLPTDGSSDEESSDYSSLEDESKDEIPKKVVDHPISDSEEETNGLKPKSPPKTISVPQVGGGSPTGSPKDSLVQVLQKAADTPREKFVSQKKSFFAGRDRNGKRSWSPRTLVTSLMRILLSLLRTDSGTT